MSDHRASQPERDQSENEKANKGEAMSCNHKHLIDSRDLFCCIAAVVPSWPSLWKGGRVKKKEKKKEHGSLSLSSTPRIKTHHSDTLLAKLD